MAEQKLGSFAKMKLTKAYWHLYNELVAEYQSQKMPLELSWYNAMLQMSNILSRYHRKDAGPAETYVLKLYNTHQENEVKKMMVHPQKDDVVSTKNTPKIEHAILRLDATIETCDSSEILVNLSTPLKQPISGSFDDWAASLPDNAIPNPETDMESFAKLYRKYILQKRTK